MWLLFRLLQSLFSTFFQPRERFPMPPSVQVHRIPEVAAEIAHNGRNGAFAVFLFPPMGETDAGPVNLQFSLEDGRVGLDWVLLAPRNVADVEKFRAFAVKRGYGVTEREMNNVRYLRVEDDTVDRLGLDVVTVLYGLALGASVELIAEGFPWPPLRFS